MDAAATQLVLNRIARAFDEDVQLTRDQEAKIRDAVIKREVLGGNLALRRNPRDYAQSPLIKHIKKHCKRSGIIYVAYVPNNNGKTTACYACMDTARRGIVFSPSTMQVGSYFDSMVRSLGFEYEDPPRGFMIRILDELEKGAPDPKLPYNFLILDNCMPQGYVPEDGRYIDDLKGHIKERNVTALILTSNKETACRLIAQNSLEEIVPLVSFAQLDELRRANPTIDPEVPLAFDWGKEVSMVWDPDELKKALEHSISFRKLDAVKRDINQLFDDVYSKLSQDQRDAAIPTFIAAKVDAMRPAISTPPRSTTPTNAGCGWDSMDSICSIC